MNATEITNFPYVIILNAGAEVHLKGVRADGFRFSGWSGDLVSPDAKHVFFLDSDVSISGDFAPFDIGAATYYDLWAPGTGYSLVAQTPDGDVNFDGIKNAIAYGLGLLPTDDFPAARYSLLPSEGPSRIGGRSAMSMGVPFDAPDDVTYAVEVARASGTGFTPWTEIARKEGDSDWTGSEAINIGEGESSDGYLRTTFEYPSSFASSPEGFMRLRVNVETSD